MSKKANGEQSAKNVGQSSTGCKACSNRDKEKKEDQGCVYCTFLQRWSKVTVMSCGGKFFGKSAAQVTREKKARAAQIKAQMDAEKAKIEAKEPKLDVNEDGQEESS